ncbi:MAG: DUF3874 domain-containing protein [Mediterranea sp.]|jgi:hypothetical protein|nr:DUF3874 domain-containing protein [Mediterranea sp.]
MKVTQLRCDKKEEASFRALEVSQLVELMKTENKEQPVSKLREEIPWLGINVTSPYTKKLPKLLPAAVFGGKGQRAVMTAYNGVVMLQVNHLSGLREAADVRQLARELPQTYLAFVGASGRSVKIWVRFSYPDGGLPATREEAEIYHAHAYQLAVKCYQPQLPFDITLLEPTLTQYCRRTWDPDLYFNPDALPIYLKQPATMPGPSTYRAPFTSSLTPQQRLMPQEEGRRTMRILFEAAFARALEEEAALTPEERDPQSRLIRLAGHCFQAGIPEEETVYWTRAHHLTPENLFLVRQTVRNVYADGEGFGRKSSLQPEQRLVMQTEEFMARRYELRFNTLTSQVECRERNSLNFRFRPVDQRTVASITMNAHHEGINLWDKDVARYLHSDRVPLCQPAEEYLYALPAWDGHDHIADLAARVPCEQPHWGALFRRWFLSMVAHWRRMDKRFANSIAPLLIGPQAYRKSTFCRLLLPPELQAYYTDSVDFGRKRDTELYLTRFLLINMDEFDQIGERQQAFLKNVLQMPVVNTRKPNAAAVEQLRRYASFIGTSNHKDLLTDTSGSRRFIAIEVTGPIDVQRPIDYGQLYAQAMEALSRNERYWLDADDEAILKVSNREFEQAPAMEQLFQVYFRAADCEEEGEWLLAADILMRIQKASRIKVSAKQIYYFGRYLQKLGIPRRRKVNGTYYHVVEIER